MKTVCTLRELIASCNLKDVYIKLHEKHIIANGKSVFEDCMAAYRDVIIKLMMKPLKKVSNSIHVSYIKDTWPDENPEMYHHVCLLNNKYEEPPQGKNPWYANNPPIGYYNANLNKYTKFYALMGMDWISLINANVVVEESAYDTKNEILLAEILWEISFYGFTEKKVEEFVKKLNKSADSVKKSISKKRK